jgi:hypothetical protein
MDKSSIAVFAAVMGVAAIRLYQKYAKKDKNKTGSNSNSPSGTSMPSSLKDDDYEPYSKK